MPVDEVCHRLVDAGIPIRLCLNLTDLLHYVRPEKIIFEAQRLGASQLTFRELFASKDICEETQWIMRHRADAQFVSRLKWYIHEHGRGLPSLGTGLKHYSLSGMSVVVDSDCMALSRPDTPRTLILREDHRLYSRWDDKGSLIF